MLLSIPNMTPRADKVHITRDKQTETWRGDYTGRAAHVPQLLLLPPNASYSGAAPSTGGGQVFLALQGVLKHHNHHDESLTAPASVALTCDEAALQFAAGADGLQVLMLQYPCRTQ